MSAWNAKLFVPSKALSFNSHTLPVPRDPLVSAPDPVPSWRVPPLIGVPPQSARLRAANTLPGPHHLWIAAAALQFEIPPVTRDTAQFARIEGMQLESY